MAKNRTTYKNNYIRAHYGRINLIVPKGARDALQTAAETKKQSLNKYINEAIREALQRDGVTIPEDPDAE